MAYQANIRRNHDEGDLPTLTLELGGEEVLAKSFAGETAAQDRDDARARLEAFMRTWVREREKSSPPPVDPYVQLMERVHELGAEFVHDVLEPSAAWISERGLVEAFETWLGVNRPRVDRSDLLFVVRRQIEMAGIEYVDETGSEEACRCRGPAWVRGVRGVSIRPVPTAETAETNP